MIGDLGPLPEQKIYIYPTYELAQRIQSGKFVGIRCIQFYRCKQKCKKVCCVRKGSQVMKVEETTYVAKEPALRRAEGRIGKQWGAYRCVVPKGKEPECPELCTEQYDK